MGFVAQATQAVSDAVSSVGHAISSSPIGEALITAAGAAVGVPPMVTAALLGANSLGQGQSLGQALATGLASYAGGTMMEGAMGAGMASTAAPDAIFTGAGADGVMTNAEAMSYGLGGADTAGGLSSMGSALAQGGLTGSQAMNLTKMLGNTGIGGVGGSLATGAGALYASEQAKQAAQQQIAGITEASGILSPAYLKAGDINAQAQTAAAQSQIAGLQGASGEVSKTLAQQQALQQPYQAAGGQALGQLSAGLAKGGQFNTPFTSAMAQNSDAEKFAQAQGLAAMRAQMAAGGQNLSSNAIQGAGTLAAGLASKYQGQAFDQYMAGNQAALGGLQNLSAQGQVSTGQLANALSLAGGAQANIQKDIGATTGAGQLGSAAATTQGLMGSAGTQASAAQQAGAVAAGGTAAQGNIIGAGASAIGNQLSGQNTLASILGQTGNIIPSNTNVASTAAPNVASMLNSNAAMAAAPDYLTAAGQLPTQDYSDFIYP